MSLSETAPEKAQESDFQTVGSRVNPACALSMESPFKAFSSVCFFSLFLFRRMFGCISKPPRPCQNANGK